MKKKVSHVKRRMKSIIPMLLIVMLIFSTAPVGALVEDSSYGNDVVVSDQGYNETTDENNDANNDLSYGYGYEDRNDVYDYGDNDSYENDKMDYEYENKEVVREEDDVDEYEEEELYYMVASLLSLSGDVTVDNIADFDLALADGDIDTIIIDGTIHFDSQRTVSRNLTISGGTITTQLGGFLVNSGAELTLEDVTIQFTGVPAAWSAVRAAVRVTGGGSTLNLGSGSVIRDFHFPGTPIINNLLISAVSVVQGGTLNVLDGSEIYNNTRGISATDAGSTVIMSGGLIHGNINNAAFSAGVPNVHGGGAIYIGPLGHLYMSGGTITNNSLYGGGGGAVRLGQLYVGTTNNRPRATFTMTGGEISHNYSIRVGGAGGFGGGVDMLNTTMNMSGGVINNNTATHGTSGTGSGGGGGGISLRSGTMVNLSGDAVLHSNRAYTPGNFAGGGGIVLNGGSTFLDVSGNAEIHSNFSASGGGGVFLADSAGFINGVVHPGFTMSGGVIRDNTTDSFGAGVAMRGAFAGWQSRFVMTGGEIRNNIAAADHNGGGVHLGNLSEFTLDGGTISGNTARDGGGVYVTSGQSLRMQSGEISGNTVTRAGGGVRVTNTTFEMAGGLIDDNTAIYGGGVHVYGNNGAFVMAEPEISALVTTFSGNAITVSNNTAQYGGGIFVNENSTLEVTDGSITGNTAAFDGGAIFTGDYETGPIPTPGVAFENIEIGEDVIFSGNSAGNGSFPPPVNAGYFTNIQFASTSIYDDLLNNYDINFYNTRIAVTFNLQGGNIGGDTDDVIVSVGYGRAMANILAAIANPARTSHNFLGWSETADGAAITDWTGIVVTGAKTYYAIWQPASTGGGGGGGGPTPQPNPVKTPDRTEARVGETINWTLRSFHNPTGNTVANFTIVDTPGQGLNFQSGRLPAFTNGTGITYEIRYTVAGSDEWHVHATGIDASRPFNFSLPQPGDLHYTNIGIFFGTVPANFGRNNEIVFTFVVGDNAPNNVLVNRFWIRYDNVEREGLSPERPVVIRDIFASDHEAYLIGYEDGTIRPNSSITRAEVATIIFRLLDDDYRAQIWSQNNPFSDVASSNWFNNAVSTLTNGGILKGFPDGAFRGNQAITRAEFVAIVARFLEDTSYTGADRFNDIDGHWANEYINVVGQHDWIRGFAGGDFRPNQDITRAEAAAIVNRMLGRLPGTPGDLLPGMVIWPDNMNQNAWYYLYIQEATNAHDFEMKADGVHETWTELREPRDWTVLERPDSRP